MKDSEKTDNLSSSSLRIRFPDDERKFPWLCMLLDAYAIIDEGIAVAVKAEEEELNIKLACKEGCDNCCRTHRDIPIYPLEIIAISWFATEKVVEPLRSLLKEQLTRHGEEDPCPFLINGSCVVHLLRPIACRQFNVFSEQCDEGEDPYFTRRDDVLSPMRDYTDRAFAAMLSFYGIPEGADKVRAARSIIQTQAINLQSFDWKTLAGLMEDFDAKNPRS